MYFFATENNIPRGKNMIYIKDNTNSYKNACRGFREYSLKLIEISKYKLETDYTYHAGPGDYHCAFYVISGSVKFENSRIIKKDLFFIPKLILFHAKLLSGNNCLHVFTS